jgi:hypothetical protein
MWMLTSTLEGAAVAIQQPGEFGHGTVARNSAGNRGGELGARKRRDRENQIYLITGAAMI